ncbi:MAG: hypothetical protein ISS36_02160 [Candidatus Aenigmarchaeota archaeon]|nr:hypothetical protein [Candidatus Aenigmarchaeota archaeon]
MEAAKKQRLSKLVEYLENIKGRHTELVTVYIPSGYNINKVAEQLRQEQSTAQNIKSKAVRKNVLSALEKILQHLKLYRQTPANGLAIFCGNVSEKDGTADIEMWAIEPPESVKLRLYRCDQNFILDHLRDMVREKEIYGLVVIDKSDAEVGLLKGKKIEPLKHSESNVPGKTKAGGWCVHEKTNIETNSQTIVDKLKEGDKIKSFDFENKRIVKSFCKRKFSRKSKVAYKIGIRYSKLMVTGEHLFFLSFDKKTKPADCLEIGDNVLFYDGFKVEREKITSIKKIKNPKGLFFDLEVPNYQSFMANGFILHNSQARYQRIRENMLNDFLRKVGEIVNSKFKEMRDLKGIIIGGPAGVKEQFAEGKYLEPPIKKKIIGIVDTSYTGEPGLKELIERSDELISEASAIRENKILERFFGELATDGLAVYGFVETIEALKNGNVEMLLLSESFDWVKAKLECPKCGGGAEVEEKEEFLKDERCSNCKSAMTVVAKAELIDEMIKLAEQMGSDVEMISDESPRGIQVKELGGIAGILRYKTE